MLRRSRIILLLLLATGCASSPGTAPGVSPASPRSPVTLSVLAVSDLHGALRSGGRDRESGRPLGGASALAATIEEQRRRHEGPTLLLDAGDLFQGTPLSNLSRGRAVVEVYELLGVDAAAVGNHEFDWGIPVLRQRIEEAGFPLLLANVAERGSGRAPPWARPYRLFERGGLRIAVIGVTTLRVPETTVPNHVAELEFTDPAAAANRWIEELVPGRADLAIVLAHVGGFRHPETGEVVGELAELAAGLRGAAALVGGHTHQLVAETLHGVPTLQPGARGRVLGRLDLTVDPASGRVLESSASLLPVWADESPTRPEVEEVLARHEREVEPLLVEVVGEAASALPRAYDESPMGNLLIDAIRHRAGTEIALQNPLGVRSDLDAGPIELREIYEVMPFDNTIVVLEMTGEEIRALLEQAAAEGGFLLASGLSYEVDYNRPIGQRVRLADATRLERSYTVAVNDFMAQGGDGLDLLLAQEDARETGVLLRDALADWIRREEAAGRTVRSRVEGRIVRKGVPASP